MAPTIILLSGPPCSGKGTQASLLSQSHSLVHLSTGDLFRDHIARETELGQQLKPYFDSYAYVPDDLATAFILDRLSQPDVQASGAILDGFPRTVSQARTLLSHYPQISTFINLKVPNKTLQARATQRRIDPATDTIYNLTSRPPPPDVPLDSLITRALDSDPLAFRTRLDVFHATCIRVNPVFSAITADINGQKSVEDVHKSIVKAIANSPPPSETPVNTPPLPSPASSTCTICLSAPGNYLCSPCGHQCGCEECLTYISNNSGMCPICRAAISNIQRVFTTANDSPTTPTPDPLPRSPPRADLDRAETTDDESSWSDDEDESASPLSLSATALSPTSCVISVNPPTAPPVRESVDVCVVIDVSGSMQATAAVNEDGTAADDGLSVLDITKHAAKSVVHMLGDEDYFSLVAFSEVGRLVLPVGPMNAAGRAKAVSALDSLSAGGCTNLWDGLRVGLDSLKSVAGGRKKTIFLLTDGVPNVNPPDGETSTLASYADTHADYKFTLNTFGFGYSLDSKLLLDLAIAGGGTFGFIPDALIVGTNFVNSVANCLSCFSPDSTLCLTAGSGAEFSDAEMDGGFAVRNESWGRHISLGALNYGQQRDIVVELKRGNEFQCVVSSEAKGVSATLKVKVEAGTSAMAAAAAGTAARARVVRVGYQAIADAENNRGKEAGESVKSLLNSLSASPLKSDVGGRMTKALQGKPRFKRWGKHYLRALMRSHQLQVCTNFMDTGLQMYGGDMFRRLREEGDKMFLSLPPPTRRVARASEPTSSPAARGRARSPSPDMNSYYAGSGGGCFFGGSRVQVVGGGKKMVKDLKAGDKVGVGGGWFGVVAHVVKVKRNGKGLVELPGSRLMLTGGHPVKVGGTWRLPRDVAGGKRVMEGVTEVWTVVMAEGENIVVEGVEAATWGSGVVEVGDTSFASMENVEKKLRLVAVGGA